MRQIRFKGKRVADGKWLYGDLIHNRGRVYIADDSIVDGSDIQGHTDFEVEADTVCQFSGVKDRLGNDIYEGDVLRHRHDGIEMHVTWFSTQFWCIQHWDDPLDSEDGSGYPLDNYFYDERWEVVGNIHDKA